MAAQTYCAGMRPYHNVAQSVGHVVRYIERTGKEVKDETPISVEIKMAGLRGPRVELIGRDVRLRSENGQTSPQEMWHNAKWDGENRHEAPCPDPHRRAGFLNIKQVLKYGLYTDLTLEHDMGGMVHEPFILYSTRLSAKAMIIRPYGLILGAKFSTPALSNTYNLLHVQNPNPPVRRDMSRYNNTPSFTQGYASYLRSVGPHVHMAVTGGYLEEMYAGLGTEVVYRPYLSLFWVGADIWSVWRRDTHSVFNMGLTSRHDFTGHLRAGYDFANGRTGVYGAVGRYLAQDFGMTFGAAHHFDNGIKIDGKITWSEREENDGMIKPTNFEPSLRLVWQMHGVSPKHRRGVDMQVRQIGRDNGQMLNRPVPLEEFTQNFSAAQIARHWPDMFLDSSK